MISKGNHVKFTRFASECLPSRHFFFRLMFYKRIIRFRFCDSQNNQCLVKSYQPKPKASPFVWLAVGEEAKQRPGLQVNVY